MSEIGVIGAGAWGTALAVLWARAEKKVFLWARDAAAARLSARLPGVALPDSLSVTSAIPEAEILVVCVPMQVLRPVLGMLPAGDAPLVICCKGLESETLLLPPEVVSSALPERKFALLTGPNFALEVARGLPAASVLAAGDAALRSELVAALRCETLRLYGSGDVVGAALGGAAKNVIAIAAGVVMGAGLGENARAALMTRGLAEISRLAVVLGGKAETVAGLSGLGDLLLTCTGEKSRNFSLGVALGRGASLAEVLGTRTNVTEGVATAPALLARAKAVGVEMPVVAAVAGLLAGTGIVETMGALMGRALRDE
jgi:glycerol-3-phosphate dehydrogenase (NAD(P)+)